LGDDPQIRYDIKSPAKLSSVTFEFEFFYDLPEKFFKCGIIRFAVKRWTAALYRKLRGIFRILKAKK
jgi:hypothetical protein